MQPNLIRKSKFALIALFTVIVFTHCKKESSNQEPATNSTLDRVIAWLDIQKQKFKDSVTRQTIASLKENLVASQISEEVIAQQQKIIIVPLKKEFKTMNVTKQQSFKNLVIFEGEDKQLTLCNIIEIIPKGQQYNKVPVNLISKIYSGEASDLNGVVSFLSLSNNLMCEREYRDGKIYSIKYLVQKKDGKSITQRTNTCIDWYYQIYVDGVLVYEEYVFTTCGGDECQTTRMIDSATPFKLNCDGGGGSGEEMPVTTQYTETEDEEDADDAGVAPTIKYIYHAVIERQPRTNEITSVVVDPVTAHPIVSMWIDGYGRGVTRTITLFNYYRNYTFLSPTSVMINWACSVVGHYVYSDATPNKTRVWDRSKMSVF